MRIAAPPAALPSPLRGANLRHELNRYVTVDAGDARELIRPRVLSERARLFTGTDIYIYAVYAFKRQGRTWTRMNTGMMMTLK